MNEELTQEQYDTELQEELNEITSTSENLLRTMIEFYKEGYNKSNPKHEIDYYLTVTNHKLDTPEGKKDIAYLRLERAIRSKIKEVEDPAVTGVELPEWQTQLVHQEMYTFRNMQERLNPKAPWIEQLYLACMYRLCGAGLEYAELLQRMKNTNIDELRDQDEKGREMSEPKIMVTSDLPKPLTPDEEQYVKDLKAMRKAEGV